MKIKEIIVPLYNARIMLYTGDYKDISDYMAARYDLRLITATGCYYEAPDANILIITPLATLSMITHEVLHAVYGIVKQKGLDVNDQEAVCYLLEYLQDQILQILGTEEVTKRLNF